MGWCIPACSGQGVSAWGVSAQGLCVQGAGCLRRCVPRGRTPLDPEADTLWDTQPPAHCMLGYTPPPVNRMTDRQELKHYLKATSFGGGGVCPGVVCPGGCLPEEVSAQGVYTPGPRGRHPPGMHSPLPIACWDTLPPVNRMTDRQV